jgi:hypothetical protein
MPCPILKNMCPISAADSSINGPNIVGALTPPPYSLRPDGNCAVFAVNKSVTKRLVPRPLLIMTPYARHDHSILDNLVGIFRFVIHVHGLLIKYFDRAYLAVRRNARNGLWLLGFWPPSLSAQITSRAWSNTITRLFEREPSRLQNISELSLDSK